jgi:transcriptional regulator with XRE-family HTH domain
MTHSPYNAKVLFGRQIRQFRLRANNMSVAQAARRMGMSESKYRKLEAGTNDSLKLPDAYSAAYIYELSTAESQHLVALVDAADSHGWYHDYDVSPEFVHYIEQEGAAGTIRVMGQCLVFGLFQTEPYMAGLSMRGFGMKRGPGYGLRVDRQEAVLNSEDPPEITYITDEAALRREVGGPDVIRGQIRHLLELNERDNIEMWVVPFASGHYPSVPGPFRIMYFPDNVFPTTVYLESLHGSHYEDSEKVVNRYEAAFQETKQPPTAVPMKEFIDASNLLA